MLKFQVEGAKKGVCTGRQDGVGSCSSAIFLLNKLFLEVVKKCQNVPEMALATAAGCGDVVGPGSW